MLRDSGLATKAPAVEKTNRNERKQMPTKLRKPVRRETANRYRGKPVVLTIAPAGSQTETLLQLRLKGERTAYVVALSDVYRLAAMWHGQKEKAAKRKARKQGIPWRQAKKDFDKGLRL
jgi:hypothetical protein